VTAYSVQLPFMPTRPEQAVPFAALVQRTGAARLWAGQARHLEQHQLYAYLAGLGLRVPAGIAVNVMPLRHPVEAAIQARSVATVTDRPVVAAFGPGATALQKGALGAPYPSQLDAVREYVTLVRQLLDGEVLAGGGEHFRYHGGLPAPAAGAPRVEVGAGVLRPAMGRLAGAVADAAVTLLAPASYLRQRIVPALRAGADAADRPMPRLVAIVPVALARAGRDPLAFADSAHLRVPHYRAMLRQAGVPVGEGSHAELVGAVVAAGAVLYGEPDELGEELGRFAAAGADEVVVSVAGVCQRQGPQAALDELDEIFTKVREGLR